MIKRTITALLATTLFFGTTAFAGAGSADFPKSGSIKFNFANNDAGFVPIFADYPANDNSAEFYELEHDRRDIPIDKAGKGLFISGNNHSDDLFMGYYKSIDGLPAGKTLAAKVSFTLATNADGGMIGIGGSPGSSVYVKCGIVSHKPEAAVSEPNGYRLNIDKGNQATDGKDMKTVGTIEKHETLFPGKYEFNIYTADIEMTSVEDGSAFLIIGTDSGFEGTTSYYISNVDLQWEEKSEYPYEQDIKDALSNGIIENDSHAWNEYISRLQFCEFAYNMVNSVKELPTAKLSALPFHDINNPKINALAFVGIVSGKGAHTFAPDDKITREQAAVILYRIAKYAEYELPEVKADISYSDNDKISDWAISPVYVLKTLEVITNSSGELFNPQTNYTVGEAASSLMKLYRLVK